MKTFITQHSVEECRRRIANLDGGASGLVRVAAKVTPIGNGNYRYVVWKTLRGTFRQDTVLAELAGDLQVRDDQSTQVTGVSRMGTFYKLSFLLYGLGIVLGFVVYLTTQNAYYLLAAVFIIILTNMGWLFIVYFRNQLEGTIEQALLK